MAGRELALAEGGLVVSGAVRTGEVDATGLDLGVVPDGVHLVGWSVPLLGL